MKTKLQTGSPPERVRSALDQLVAFAEGAALMAEKRKAE